MADFQLQRERSMPRDPRFATTGEPDQCRRLLIPFFLKYFLAGWYERVHTEPWCQRPDSRCSRYRIRKRSFPCGLETACRRPRPLRMLARGNTKNTDDRAFA